MPKRDRDYDPHRRLAAAVVADAVKELGPRNGKGVKRTANAWLWTERAANWMELLGFDPAAVRSKLVKQGRLKPL